MEVAAMKRNGRGREMIGHGASKGKRWKSMGRSNGHQLLGVWKHLVIGRMLLNTEVRKLPIGYLLSMRGMFDGMKFLRFGGQTYLNSFFPPFPSRAFDRAVEVVGSHLSSDRRLYLGDFNVTGNCRLRCRHCYRRGRRGADLPLDVIRRGMRELQELGVCLLGITGGEPLLREDLGEILASIDDRSSIILYTTGDGLTRQRAGELVDLGVKAVIISIDHYDPAAHDRQRRFKGSFGMAVKAVEFFSNLDVYTSVTVIPTEEMVEENGLYRYLECAREWGAHEVRIGIPLPSGKLLKTPHEGTVLLSRSKINKIKEIQIAANRQRRYPIVMAFPIMEGVEMFGCGCGYHNLSIENDGSVTPCVLLPMAFGNIRDESLHDIWRRMKSIFNRPGGVCYMRQAAYPIYKEFMQGNSLPLPVERSLEICQQIPPAENPPLPRFYGRLFKYIDRYRVTHAVTRDNRESEKMGKRQGYQPNPSAENE
jgi:MoaA/NifB/PqqE/SkfB family radical SAM enzyme